MDVDNETINAEIAAMRADGYDIRDVVLIDYGMSARVTATKNGASRIVVVGALFGYCKDAESIAS